MAEKSYKQQEKELSELMQRVESESYDDLDQLMKDYESGMKLIKDLETKLKNAKNKIQKVN